LEKASFVILSHVTQEKVKDVYYDCRFESRKHEMKKKNTKKKI